ncbi:hypothetical protein FRC08_006250 [Ceratobasidium sp. 394]|nr:hypothetical protein FRC08_006250 [Ceratobasidium sp. 394]
MYRGLGLPGLTTTYQQMNCPHLRPSIYFPTTADVSFNIASMFRPIHEPSASNQSQPCRRLWSILIDEVAVEKRPHYYSSGDAIAGICREHSSSLDLTAVTSRGLAGIQAVQASLESSACHHAREATVVAIAGFGKEAIDYSACVVLVSGTCKTESERDGFQLIHTVIESWKVSPQGEAMHGPIASLATDGDPTRRRAFHAYCTTQQLSPSSPLYELLGTLPLFNTYCGLDEITHDGDFKHEEKRFASALRTKDGILVSGTLINSGLVKQNLIALPNESATSIAQLFDITDHQNLPKANRLLNLIYEAGQLPHIASAPEQRSFVLLGELLFSFTQPFTNPTLSLMAQLTHLSTCGHLLFALYRVNHGSFIPGQLYYDVQTTIKNAYFTVAKSQLLNPQGPIYLLQCGTDRLESRFSTLRTMTHDRNMDIIQLCERAESAQHVDEIFARNPDLNKGSYRLSIDGSAGIDHTNPTSWEGNVIASSAGIRAAWSAGWEHAAKLLTRAGVAFSFDKAQLLHELSSRSSTRGTEATVDLMRPFGSYVGIQVETIDVQLAPSETPGVPATEVDHPVTAASALSDDDLPIENLLPPAHSSTYAQSPTKQGWIDVDGKPIHAESLIRCCLGLDDSAKSTDRLRRVIGLTRSPYKTSLSEDRILGTDFLLGNLVLVFICVDSTPAAAIIRVTSITKGNGDMVEGLAYSELQDATILLGGQVLALKFDSDTKSWVWDNISQWETLPIASTKSTASKSTSSSTIHTSKQASIVQIPASLALPINPGSQSQPAGIWAFDHEPLHLLASQHWAAISANKDLVPVRSGTATFPYRGPNDERCFLQAESVSLDTSAQPNAPWPCYLCYKEFKIKDMRKHVASHILAPRFNVQDPNVMFPHLAHSHVGSVGAMQPALLGGLSPRKPLFRIQAALFTSSFRLQQQQSQLIQIQAPTAP